MSASTLGSIDFKRRQVALALAAVIVFLAAGNFLTLYVQHGLGYLRQYGVRRLFDLGAEQNFPSMFSAGLFALDGLLLLFIHREHQRRGLVAHPNCWKRLGWLFLYLALDEAVSLHELLVRPARLLPFANGVLYFAWMIPYGAALLALAFCLARWFFDLDPSTRWRFFFAGALFLSGAMGVEMLEGVMTEQGIGDRQLRLDIYMSIEDLLEMSGLALFADSLMRHLERLGGAAATISLKASPASA